MKPFSHLLMLKFCIFPFQYGLILIFKFICPDNNTFLPH